MAENQNIAESDIHIDADATTVWDAITTNAGLSEWMGAGSTINPTPDGEINVPDIATGRQRSGRIDQVEPGRRLGFTWWPEDDPTDWSTVEINIEDKGESTRVLIVETQPRLRLVGATAQQGAWAWRAAMASVSCSMVRQ